MNAQRQSTLTDAAALIYPHQQIDFLVTPAIDVLIVLYRHHERNYVFQFSLLDDGIPQEIMITSLI